VQPTHKKGNKKLAANYRPIGLTCILSKVCERVVRDQLVAHLNTQGIVTDRQHGFRAGRSTITSLLQTQLEWKAMLRQHEQIYVVLLDFSKAFDVVDHGKLKSKLYDAGLRGPAILWLNDYLDRRTMSIVVDDHESTMRHVHSGVIQGSAAGPALFSHFANDIPECIGNAANSSIFADDVKLFSPWKDELESAADNVAQWSRSNALPLAPAKTVFIKIRRRRAPRSIDTIQIDGTTVHSTQAIRDLGIIVNDDLECSAHVSHIVKKAFRTSNLLIRILKTRRIDIHRKAFNALVLPGLEYASVVWNPIYAKDVNNIESVLRRYTRRVNNKCRLPYKNYATRLSNWSMMSLETRRVLCDLTMVYKILYGFVDLDRDLYFRVVTNSDAVKIFPHEVASDQRNNTQLNTIAHRSYQLWNKLPVIIRNSISVNSFKYRLKKYNITNHVHSKITP
jgi:hypothetical protein